MLQLKRTFHPLIHLGAAAAAAVLLAGCQALNPAGLTVTGTGDPAKDVQAVQNAVDRGGTVLLKGIFDFGDKGSVTITRDVTVTGEAAEAGKPQTVIKGGRLTLQSLRPDGARGPGPKVAIRQIHFDGATWAPINVAFSSGTVVSGNLITRVRPVPVPPSSFSGGKPYNMQQGVIVRGAPLDSDKLETYVPDSVTGPLAITDNEIDLASDVPTTTLAMGVWVMYTTGVHAEIAQNRIRNVSRNGMEVIDNYRGKDGGGQMVIRDNHVETPAEGIPMPTPRAPNGLSVGYWADGSAAGDASRAIPHTLTRNTVRARGRTPSSVGISVMTDKAAVTDNRVTLEGPGTWGMVLTGSYNRVAGNLIEGSGSFGILLVPTPPMMGSNNELTNNDLGRLKAARGNVMLMKGAKHNRVVGSSGSVNDMGEGNLTEGLQRVTAAPR